MLLEALTVLGSGAGFEIWTDRNLNRCMMPSVLYMHTHMLRTDTNTDLS